MTYNNNVTLISIATSIKNTTILYAYQNLIKFKISILLSISNLVQDVQQSYMQQ